MIHKKIAQLPKVNFTGDKIDNCFYVENFGTNMVKVVPLESVFQEIIKRAKTEGLKITLTNNRIILEKIEI